MAEEEGGVWEWWWGVRRSGGEALLRCVAEAKG